MFHQANLALYTLIITINTSINTDFVHFSDWLIDIHDFILSVCRRYKKHTAFFLIRKNRVSLLPATKDNETIGKEIKDEKENNIINNCYGICGLLVSLRK